MPKNKAVFIDRDGVINKNRQSYVRSWDDVEFLPGVLDALARLSKSVYKTVIVTNQSAVGRGLISLEQANMINQQIVDEIVFVGGRIDAIYMCPHKPDDNCLCRKPKPGMILQARNDMDLDLGSSILIGDTLNDLIAGHTAGISVLALVRTGLDQTQDIEELPNELSVIQIFDNLPRALDSLILNNDRI